MLIARSQSTISFCLEYLIISDSSVGSQLKTELQLSNTYKEFLCARIQDCGIEIKHVGLLCHG